MAWYIGECQELGFDTIEISSGFITIPTDDWLRLAERVQMEGLKANPDVFGWYIKNYDPEVNFFVDHSQIVQLEGLRRGSGYTQSSARCTCVVLYV